MQRTCIKSPGGKWDMEVFDVLNPEEYGGSIRQRWAYLVAHW